MQCKCGGTTTESDHEVKTASKAKEWVGLTILDSDLPIQINQHKCVGCERMRFSAYSQAGELIARRG